MKSLDMTGWVMKEHGVPNSHFTVLYKDTSKPSGAGRHTHWICQCDCEKHTIKSIDGCALRSGHVISCGCAKQKGRETNEVGNRYGKLTVLEYRGLDKNSKAKWLVQCDCGSEPFEVLGTSLRNGNTSSCGCARTAKQAIDEIIGTRYNNLTIIDRDKSNYSTWICQCDCGNIINVKGIFLRSGKVKSCGCLISKGEETILKWLQEHHIDYKKEYCFKDLVTENGGNPRFDFAIFKNDKLFCLIEFQGKQHYDNEQFGFYQREVTDKLKRDYCSTHNLPLYEIRYNSDIIKELEKIL